MIADAGARLAALDVAVLAGGLGTRLAARVPDRPKVMADIAGRPFLDHLLDWLAAQGARRVVLGLGHRAESVTAHLAAHPRNDLDVATSVEDSPRGTAGAIALARRYLRSDPAIVINGDTFLDVDLAAAVATHARSGAAGTIVCVEVESTARYGRVEIGADGRIAAFREKDPADARPGWINGGVYVLGAALLDRIAGVATGSLERDVLAAAPHELAAHCTRARFVDIGTPESYDDAARVILGPA